MEEEMKVLSPMKKEGIDMGDVLEFALEMGRVLLRNGAEIFRVEETIEHICRHYEIKSVDAFVLSNGIFITAENDDDEIFAKVKHIPLSGFHLGVVTEVNDLSREVSAGKITIENAWKKLNAIKLMPPKRNRFRIFAAGVGSGCFCYLLQGNLLESLIATSIGALLYVFVIFAEKHKLSKIIVNIIGGAFITVMALLAVHLPWGYPLTMDKVIIGSILPLVPGVAFINSIRDITNSDFISGTVRIIDTVLVFVYIAIGVGTMLGFYNSILGGLGL